MWAKEQKGFKDERRKEMIGGFSGTFDGPETKRARF